MPRELAEELNLSRSTVTRFLDSLQRRGLLTRKSGAKDGREVQVCPTQTAKLIHEKLEQTGGNLTKLMVAIIGKDDLSNTVARLRVLQRTLENR